MKGWRLILFSLVVAVAAASGLLTIRHFREAREERVRQHQYRAEVSRFANALHPGTSRHQVELYLKAQDFRPVQMCCVSVHHRGYSELVKVGQEKAPWYCSELNIYVAFEFDPAGATETSEAKPDDQLSDVTLFPWLEGCM